MKDLDPKLHWWIAGMTDQLEAIRPSGTEVILAVVAENGDYYTASHLPASVVTAHLKEMAITDFKHSRYIVDKTNDGTA